MRGPSYLPLPLQLGETKCDDLGDCADEVNLKLSLWQGSAEFEALTASWNETHFESLDVAAMEETVTRFHKMVFKMERGLMPNKLVPKLRNEVDEYRNLQPVVQALRNRALKERHWTKIFVLIDKQIPRDETFTLQVLLDARVQDWKDGIAQISTEATQELALEELLNKVQNKWADVEFQALPYKEVKDTYILGGIEDVQVCDDFCGN